MMAVDVAAAERSEPAGGRSRLLGFLVLWGQLVALLVLMHLYLIEVPLFSGWH